MIVTITRSEEGYAEGYLEDPHDFTYFHVAGHGLTLEELANAVPALGLGVVVGENAFLEPEAIIMLAGEVDTSWRARFDGMVEYARDKGWTDGEGLIQAHLQVQC